MRLLPVHSEQASCEELEFNLMFRWFLDMDLLEHSFDATVFARNRARRLVHEVGPSVVPILLDEDRARDLRDRRVTLHVTPYQYPAIDGRMTLHANTG